MKAIGVVLTLLAALIGGHAAQSYALPRIGLEALEFGEYFVLFAIYAVAYLVVGIGKALLDG